MNPSIIRSLLLVCAILPAAGQNLDLPYSSGSSGIDGAFIVPNASNAVSAFGMAYDSDRREIVRFGGQTVAGVQNAQTWIHRQDGWQLTGVPVSPPSRAFCAMAFDDTRNEVVLFGGLSGASTRLNDTWVWNGTTWSQKSPVNSPPERSHTAMAWDAERGQVVLFGGRGAAGALQDTWVWDGTDWTRKSPVTSPPARVNHAMAAYPAFSRVAMACGNSVDAINADTALGDLWLWSGQDWSLSGSVFPVCEAPSLVFDPVDSTLLLYGGAVRVGATTTALSSLTAWSQGAGATTLASLSGRYQHGAVWHGVLNRMLVNGGRTTAADIADTYAWSDNYWTSVSFPNYTFDLNSKPDAIWHFTSITVQSGATVTFKRNAANNPVLWLASETVTINGSIDVSGAPGGPLGSSTALGGSGGYNGSVSMGPGQGPGGGRAFGYGGWSNFHGEGGKHAVSLTSSTYGTPFAQPLIGGSGGGGGGGLGVPSYMGQGGGGGGAIAIASSKDIVILGSILARGGIGYRPTTPTGVGGSGSGGAVRLVADRIIAPSGTISASGGGGFTSAPYVAGESGRIRLEAYIRQTNPSLLGGVVSQSVPVLGSILTQAGGRLWFVKVAGENVANPPRGDVINPDVIFTATGDVEIEVHALNVPDGTPVTVTINHSLAGVINLPAAGQPPVTLAQCKATFTANIPAGQGVMQAFATYNVGGPTPPP